MGLLTESLWVDLMLVAVPPLLLMYWFLTNVYYFWDRKGVVNVKGGLILNQLLGKKSQAETVREWYEQFPGEKVIGFIQIVKPVLLIRDADLIHRILVKDFHHFQDRGQPRIKKDLMSNNLLAMTRQMWREMRYKLTPTFTTGKLKGMFEQVAKCGENMVRKIEELSKKNADIETKDVLFEFTSDVIASCAFGVQFEPNTPDFDIFKSSVQQIFKPSKLGIIKVVFAFASPKLAEFLDIRPFMGKRNSEYFMNLIKEAAKYRKEHDVKRNDYLQLLLTLKDTEERGDLHHVGLTSTDTCEDDEVILNQMKYAGGHDKDHNQPPALDEKLFTDETVCANSVIFLVAGSESSSSTIRLTLYQLATNLDIQQRLQEEVDTVLANHGGQWSFQAIREMTYLDQVVQESQRMYPIISLLQRECTETYLVPDSNLVIEKGQIVTIPVSGLHKDPQFYPEPDKFKPERFRGNNFKPNPAFLPFGDGPRICIAMRFAVMEVKTSLARIMADYNVKLSPKTQIPLKLDPRSFVPSPKGGLWLQFEKRSKKL